MIRGRFSSGQTSGKSAEWFLTKDALIMQLRAEGSSAQHQLRACLLLAFNALAPFNEKKLCGFRVRLHSAIKNSKASESSSIVLDEIFQRWTGEPNADDLPWMMKEVRLDDKSLFSLLGELHLGNEFAVQILQQSDAVSQSLISSHVLLPEHASLVAAHLFPPLFDRVVSQRKSSSLISLGMSYIEQHWQCIPPEALEQHIVPALLQLEPQTFFAGSYVGAVEALRKYCLSAPPTRLPLRAEQLARLSALLSAPNASKDAKQLLSSALEAAAKEAESAKGNLSIQQRLAQCGRSYLDREAARDAVYCLELASGKSVAARDEFVRLRERVDQHAEDLWQPALDRLLSAEFASHSHWTEFVLSAKDLLARDLRLLQRLADALSSVQPTLSGKVQQLFVQIFENLCIRYQNSVRSYIFTSKHRLRPNESIFESLQAETSRQLTTLFNQLTSESAAAPQTLISLSRCLLLSPRSTMHKILQEAIHNKHQSEFLLALLIPLMAEDVFSLFCASLLSATVDHPPASAPHRDNLIAFVRTASLQNCINTSQLFTSVLLDALDAALFDPVSVLPLSLRYVRIGCAVASFSTSVPLVIQWRVFLRLAKVYNIRSSLRYDDIEALVACMDLLHESLLPNRADALLKGELAKLPLQLSSLSWEVQHRLADFLTESPPDPLALVPLFQEKRKIALDVDALDAAVSLLRYSRTSGATAARAAAALRNTQSLLTSYADRKKFGHRTFLVMAGAIVFPECAWCEFQRLPDSVLGVFAELFPDSFPAPPDCADADIASRRRLSLIEFAVSCASLLDKPDTCEVLAREGSFSVADAPARVFTIVKHLTRLMKVGLPLAPIWLAAILVEALLNIRCCQDVLLATLLDLLSQEGVRKEAQKQQRILARVKLLPVDLHSRITSVMELKDS